MGVVNNNAIIATTWDKKEVARIKEWVDGFENDFWKGLSLFSGGEINGRATVVMIPDGSKEGWDESNYGDTLRDKFVAVIEKANYEDGSSPWAFVEVGFGEYGQKVLRGNCENCYSDAEYAEG